MELERIHAGEIPGGSLPPRSLYSGEGTYQQPHIQLQQLFSATHTLPSLQPTQITQCVHVPSGSWAKCSTVSLTF